MGIRGKGFLSLTMTSLPSWNADWRSGSIAGTLWSREQKPLAKEDEQFSGPEASSCLRCYGLSEFGSFLFKMLLGCLSLAAGCNPN